MRKAIFTLFVLFIAAQIVWSQSAPPSNLTGSSLRTWLKSNWYDGKCSTLDYGDARSQMYGYIFEKDDKIQCVYTGYKYKSSYNTKDVGDINCEHTVPQSYFGKKDPMKSDIHHLFPTHNRVNSSRSNYPFKEINDSYTDKWFIYDGKYITQSNIPSSNIDAYSELETDGTNSFEPREDHKGDVARAIFYFYTMYPTQAGDISRVANINTLYEWHKQDPVTAWDIERNKRIKKKQGNSNPYIEYPELVARAWGFQGSQIATPVFTPSTTVHNNSVSVSITCATSGASIYYTTDGSTPTTSSNKYSTPFNVTETTTVKAIAVKSGLSNSNVASITYTITSGNISVINNVRTIPEVPVANESVHVIVTLKDGFSPKSVKLIYSSSDNSQSKSITMKLSEGKYKAAIPGFNGGVKVTYKIEVSDNSNQKSVYSGTYTHNGTTSITTGKINNLIVYPNPATDYINITINNKSVIDYDIYIYNVEGKKIYSDRHSKSLSKRIDISGFKQGVYILYIYSDQLNFHKRFIKR
jgi:endonuclease I